MKLCHKLNSDPDLTFDLWPQRLTHIFNNGSSDRTTCSLLIHFFHKSNPRLQLLTWFSLWSEPLNPVKPVKPLNPRRWASSNWGNRWKSSFNSASKTTETSADVYWKNKKAATSEQTLSPFTPKYKSDQKNQIWHVYMFFRNTVNHKPRFRRFSSLKDLF